MVVERGGKRHAVLVFFAIEAAGRRPNITKRWAVYREFPRGGSRGFCMKAFFAGQTALGHRAVALCCVFIVMKSSIGLAQTTSAVSSPPAAKEDVPPGGCMPIGITASGEMVFPLLCKEFIERARGQTVEKQPDVPVDKPVAEQQQEAAAPSGSKPAEKPVDADKPIETGSLPERVERPHRVGKSDDCTHNRTYDRASGTYKGYDGRRRPCLEPESDRTTTSTSRR